MLSVAESSKKTETGREGTSSVRVLDGLCRHKKLHFTGGLGTIGRGERQKRRKADPAEKETHF